MKNLPFRIKLFYFNSLQNYSKVALNYLIDSDYDFEIEKIYSLDEFKNRVVRYDPELILVDHHYESHISNEAVRFLKDSNVNTPLILLTDYESEESAQNLVKAGACDYVFIDRPKRLPVTIAKKVEKERLLHYTVQQLDKSVWEFSELVENLPFGLAIWNHSQRLVYFNKALLNLNYNSADDFKTQPLTRATLDLYDSHNNSIILEKDVLGECFSEGRTIMKDDLYIMRSDGSRRYISLVAIPMKNPAGAINSAAIIFIDLTKQKSASLNAKVLSDLIQFKNNELGQFSYIISHNLRDPIAKILGLTSIWDAPKADPEFILTKIREEADKLDSIVKDLNVILSVRNVENEKKEMVSFPYELSLVAQMLQKEILESKAEVSIDFSEATEIFTVKSYLYSVLYNLLSNSIKYRDQTRPLSIKIKTTVSEEYFCLSVKDNGLGIDLDKNGNKIFGLYKRFHPNSCPGKGLGLHFVKKYAEALGGKIEIRSMLNTGTEIKVYFSKSMNHAV